MIGAVSGVPVFLAAGVTDMRRGIGGLCAQARNVLQENPAGGAVFVFRGRKGDRLKILHWDGQGFCPYYKVLERGAAERGLRSIGVGRRNWLFAGSNAGGETMARALTLIETAKLNGLNPQAYLADVLARINDHKIIRLGELLPWNWKLSSHATANKLAS